MSRFELCFHLCIKDYVMDYAKLNRELSLVALGMALGGGSKVRQDVEPYVGYVSQPERALLSAVLSGDRGVLGSWLKEFGVDLKDAPVYLSVLEAFKKIAARNRLKNFRQQVNEISMHGADLSTISKMENLLVSMRVALMEIGPSGEGVTDDLQSVNNTIEESAK